MLDSRSRRAELFWNGIDQHLAQGPNNNNMSRNARDNLKRMIFFAGSVFYAAREIPGLERGRLPVTLCAGTATNGDTMRCVGCQSYTAPTALVSPPTFTTPSPTAEAPVDNNNNSNNSNVSIVAYDGLRCQNCARTFLDEQELLQHCRRTGHSLIFRKSCKVDRDNKDSGSVPATTENFVAYVNLVLQRAMGERLTKWGKSTYVDRTAPNEALDRRGNPLGVTIFQAIQLSFGILRVEGNPACLTLTCDLRAKVIRTTSVLQDLYGNMTPQQAEQSFTPSYIKNLEKLWIGQVVIYKHEKKCMWCRCHFSQHVD